jgi:Nuclease-related domain.
MDQGTVPDTASWTLRSRGPAHAASHRCLALQRRARPRGPLARLFGVSPLHPDAVAWFRGALAERRVGRVLGRLGDGWRVLHAVPYGEDGGDIDHLVIGPAGVFTINAAAHAPAAVDEARAASRFLSRATGATVDATPLVALVSSAAPAPAALGAPVAVPASRLVRYLSSRPTRLAPDVVAIVTRAAEEWTTWRPFGVDLPVHTDPDAAFARLHADVVGARVVRAAWGALALAAVVVALVASASGAVS